MDNILNEHGGIDLPPRQPSEDTVELFPDCPVAEWKETVILTSVKKGPSGLIVDYGMDPVWPKNKNNQNAEVWVKEEGKEPRTLGRLGYGSIILYYADMHASPEKGDNVVIFVSGLFDNQERNVLARSNAVEYVWE